MAHMSRQEQNACATGGQILEIGAAAVGTGFHTMGSGPLPSSRDVSIGGVAAVMMDRKRSAGAAISLMMGALTEPLEVMREGMQGGEAVEHSLAKRSEALSGGMSDVIPFQPVTLVFQDLR